MVGVGARGPCRRETGSLAGRVDLDWARRRAGNWADGLINRSVNWARGRLGRYFWWWWWVGESQARVADARRDGGPKQSKAAPGVVRVRCWSQVLAAVATSLLLACPETTAQVETKQQ